MPADASNNQVAALAAVSRRFRDGATVARLRKSDAAGALGVLTAP
jgi:hypothetical protein